MTKKMSPSAQLEQDSMVAEIKKAHQFSAHIRYGPHDKVTRYFENPDPRVAYAEAVAARTELEAESKFGRQGLVYAINTLGSFSVDDELARLAGLI